MLKVILLLFIQYIILRYEMGKLADLLDFIDKDYVPILVWIMLIGKDACLNIGYIFFPS
jgi:hypothetical protein